MKNLKNHDIFFILLFIILSYQSQAQDYYIYGKTQPKLKTLPEIAEHYQVDVLEMLEASQFRSENFASKYWTFEDTIYNITRKWLSWDLEDKLELDFGKVKKLFSYKYIHLFPLEKGDSLTLPCGKINPVNRQGNFEEFDKLFPEISVPKDFIFSYDKALGVLVSLEKQPSIPKKLSNCMCNSIEYEEFWNMPVPRFKFRINEEVTAYFVLTKPEYPFFGHLYLFRNTDKKLCFEKGILVYKNYAPSPDPSGLYTNTQIQDYDEDGDLDILVYKVHYSYADWKNGSIEGSMDILLWDAENKRFVEKNEFTLQKSFHSQAEYIYSEEELSKILESFVK